MLRYPKIADHSVRKPPRKDRYIYLRINPFETFPVSKILILQDRSAYPWLKGPRQRQTEEQEANSSAAQHEAKASCSGGSSGSADLAHHVSDPALSGVVTDAHAILIDHGPVSFHNRQNKCPSTTGDGGLGGKVCSLAND